MHVPCDKIVCCSQLMASNLMDSSVFYRFPATNTEVRTQRSWIRKEKFTGFLQICGTDCLQALYRELTRPQFQKGICHHCGSSLHGPYYHHFTLAHTHLSDPGQTISSLLCMDSDILRYAKHFSITCSAIAGLHCLNFELWTLKGALFSIFTELALPILHLRTHHNCSTLLSEMKSDLSPFRAILRHPGHRPPLAQQIVFQVGQDGICLLVMFRPEYIMLTVL